MRNRKTGGVRYALFFVMSFIFCLNVSAQEHSVAREWNEQLLHAIRNDFARPTVHARNLFHTSIALYDSWAAYDDNAETVFLGKSFGGFNCPFSGIIAPADIEAAREETMSYAAYRLLRHRFAFSPGSEETLTSINELFAELGYDATFDATNYQETNEPAALGNYLAEKIIEFGFTDGSNEQFEYTNQIYQPVNDPLKPHEPGNPDMTDPNRWQPLALETFIDQSGNEIPIAPEFLSPEWGRVVGFALNSNDLDIHQRDGEDWWTYHDPGQPPYIDDESTEEMNPYKWGFALVAVWSSHLDPSDGVMWDISPRSIGKVPDLPTSFDGHYDFYDFYDGGDPSIGHELNPVTNQPYETQSVPRGDYGRVLAEFWADGPDSETPPGHWFTILNYVSDHPMCTKQYKGQGEPLDDLEWDVKSYLALAGAVHDCAISAWGVKGYYDYLRPVSAIRYMADQGQCTDQTLPSYDPRGIPLIDGYIELVEAGDPLAGASNENVGKIKLYAWKGPDFIADPDTDEAGVGWILAENWWPYQRPTFVTPPFAGYVSGHSTFSRAAAEVLTMFTGDEYFPGGMGEFIAKKNEFLVFEEGPSVDVKLQWATYRDASDQTSLSRIWGGIHPPADDIPGRLMGIEIGIDAFEKADEYFNHTVTSTPTEKPELLVFPNPVASGADLTIHVNGNQSAYDVEIIDLEGKVMRRELIRKPATQSFFTIKTSGVSEGIYTLRISARNYNTVQKFIIN